MNLGIYKPGQGYWVRVLTAAFSGMLVLAAAAWALGQAESIDLPTPTWVISVSAQAPEIPDGQRVSFQIDATGEEVASATVLEHQRLSSGVNVTVGELEFAAASRDLAQANRVKHRGGVLDEQVVSFRGVPVFEPLYLQGGVAGAALLLGAVFVYWFAGLNRRSVDFLIATDGEMRKVNWSTKKHIFDSTVVVIVASFLIAASLFAVDFLFGEFFHLIGVLRR